MLDRKIVFAELRKTLFKSGYKQSQVDGLTLDFDIWEQHFVKRTPLTQLAYCLATEFHETARTMQPIKEFGDTARFMRLYDVSGSNPKRARDMGNVRVGDGAKYCGRGKVQLTWFVNYDKATKELRKLGLIAPDVDFTKDPDKVMEPRVSAFIMFLGMEGGWFTGRSLDAIVDPNIDGDEYADFVKSRAIINGNDAAELIAGYARDFLTALRLAWVEDAPGIVPKPVVVPAPPPVIAQPIPDVPPVVQKEPEPPGFWSNFGKLLGFKQGA